jgi:crossover junction endodeoxyribonuclease RuvC
MQTAGELQEKVVLGIDPGTIVMGYGLLRACPSAPKALPAMITMGVLQLDRYEDYYLRLRKIFERVSGLINEYKPDEMAIEAPFFGKNVQSMLKLGRAQGVAMAAALLRDIPIYEYAPLKIKMAITGNGAASKEQVAGMLRRILHIPDRMMSQKLDATDGLAAALCHLMQANAPASEKKYTDWKDFAAKNPKKVVR